MRQVRVGVADSVHDGQLPGIPHALGVAEARVQAERAVERKNLIGRDGHIAIARPADVVVLAVGVRHHGVQPVVASVQHDVDDDAVVGADRCCSKCLVEVETEVAESEATRSQRIEGRAAEHAATDRLEELAAGPSASAPARRDATATGGHRQWRYRDRASSSPHAMWNSGASMVIVSRLVAAHHLLGSADLALISAVRVVVESGEIPKKLAT